MSAQSMERLRYDLDNWLFVPLTPAEFEMKYKLTYEELVEVEVSKLLVVCKDGFIRRT